MDAAAAKLRAAGWRVAWTGRQTGGYPFHLDLDVTGLVVTDPSGWGLATQQLKTDAYAFAPTHVVFYVPDGRVTVTRPGDGPIDVQAGVLRGSVSGVGEGVPNLALEGDDIHFAALNGAPALPLAAAKNLQVYTRPGPNDQGAVYLSFDGGVAGPSSWLAAFAGNSPMSLRTDATFAHAGAFSAPTWRAALTAWTAAGGALEIQHFALSGGAQQVFDGSGRLTIDGEGRLAGDLNLSLAPPEASMIPLLALSFHDGAAWVDQKKAQPTPRLF